MTPTRSSVIMDILAGGSKRARMSKYRKEKDMKSVYKFVKTIFVLMVILVFPGLALADLYWESEQVSKGVQGQPDETQTVKNYMTEYASRTDMENRVTIMDFDKMVIFQLNPADKTYVKNNMKDIGRPPGMKEEEVQAFQEMMRKMIGEVKVVPTNEKKKIAGYNCVKYELGMMATHSEYWLSKEVNGYEEMKTVGRKMAGVFDTNPMLKQMNIAGMMSQLDGFPVQMVTNLMGGTITSTLKKVDVKKLDKDLFKVPTGYTEQQSAN
jgi:Domain of unknown function (DUF4412)